MARHFSVEAVTQYFTFEHLPPHLRPVSEACANLVTEILNQIPEDSPELTVGLRKVLEAKDCFVRAALKPTDVGVKNNA